ncbi:MAG: hypothetical protein ACKOC9_15195 [Alphaproteobacteria bacterium]
MAALRQAARDAGARPSARLMLQARPEVIVALRDLPGALDEYTTLTGRVLEVQTVPSGPSLIRETIGGS